MPDVAISAIPIRINIAGIDTKPIAYPAEYATTHASSLIIRAELLQPTMRVFDNIRCNTNIDTKGYNIPSICVDVHVHRISNRLGLVNTKEPEETEFELKAKLPKKNWSDINTLFVTLGQNICKPQNPDCNACSLQKFCKFYKDKH